jgi:hypothetical protein
LGIEGCKNDDSAMNLQKEQEEMRKGEENHKERDEDNRKLLENGYKAGVTNCVCENTFRTL